jgi:hypothetical protein
MRQFQTAVYIFLLAAFLFLFPGGMNSGTAKPLPKGLPAWFKQLDKDHDGQVSLNEWLRGGRTRDEFLLYDLNGDGFITPEEVMRVISKSVQHLTLEKGLVNYDGPIETTIGEPYQNKTAFKIFTVKLEEGKTYVIEEVSQVYFAYLYLENPSGAVVDQNDSGGVGQTARLIHEAAETGTYRIIATSQGGFRTGDFSLSIRRLRDPDDNLLKDDPILERVDPDISTATASSRRTRSCGS